MVEHRRWATSGADDCFFSVLVPVFNTELLLRECLLSIARQSFEQFEVIVVDDGSTDSSAAICDEFEMSDSRFRVIHQENRGLLEARKSALRLAQGAYCLFVDSDDMLRSDALEVLHRKLASTWSDFVAFNCCSNLQFAPDRATSQYSINHSCDSHDLLSEFRRGLLTTDKVNHIILKAVKLDMLQNLLEQDEVRLLLYEDKYEMTFIFDAASTCSVIEDVLYYYRPNQLSITRRGYSQSDYQDLRFVSSHLDEYYEKWNVCTEGEFYALRLTQIYTEINKIFSCVESAALKKRASSSIKNDAFFTEALGRAELSLLPVQRRLSIWLFDKGYNHLLSCLSVLIRKVASVRAAMSVVK